MPVISYVLRLAALLCMTVLVVSFAAFASDEAGHGSKETVAKVGSGTGVKVARPVRENLNEANPSPLVERRREQQHSKVREIVDDGNDALTSSFSGLGGDSIWSRRILQGLLAFVVFGVGLGFLSRYAAGRGL